MAESITVLKISSDVPLETLNRAINTLLEDAGPIKLKGFAGGFNKDTADLEQIKGQGCSVLTVLRDTFQPIMINAILAAREIDRRLVEEAGLEKTDIDYQPLACIAFGDAGAIAPALNRGDKAPNVRTGNNEPVHGISACLDRIGQQMRDNLATLNEYENGGHWFLCTAADTISHSVLHDMLDRQQHAPQTLVKLIAHARQDENLTPEAAWCLCYWAYKIDCNQGAPLLSEEQASQNMLLNKNVWGMSPGQAPMESATQIEPGLEMAQQHLEQALQPPASVTLPAVAMENSIKRR